MLFLWFGALSSTWADITLVPVGSTWKYLDNGTNQGTAWRAASFNDGAWASGPAELGYGDGDEATVVSYGPNSSARYTTTYFRYSFSVANPAAFVSLKLRLLRDDGAVVYLNGVEVRRDNMPTGTITSTTLASTALSAPAEDTFYETSIATTNLVAGTNVLAVEVHQANGTSTDVSFDLELIGATSQSVTRGPYLQKATPTNLTIRWRTNASSDSVVKYGTDPANLNATVNDATATTEHEVTLSGLTPDTRYYYSIGTSAQTLASGSEYTFFTPPPVGTSQPTRVWVLGDAGTGGDGTNRAESVRNAYTTYAGSRYTDVWLMLGDNAYDAGLDTEYQRAVFDTYPSFLRQTAIWSAIGNHETAQATNPPASLPYFQMFSFPTQGEAGGVPSGTEKYYSFDHGDIHFICLDSMTSARTPGSPMLTWLENDLASTTQRWIIAFWHHPPYTKGSHNSDTEVELTEMRQYVLPMLEAGGVDLVLSGHSHCYERSMLINGHYGQSTSFSTQNIINGGTGKEDGTGAYSKPNGLSANQGAVYVVAGSSGKVSAWTDGSTADINPNPHPAMIASLRRLGSMVVDVDGNRMDVKFLRETGTVDDYFTLVKNVPNNAPTIQLTSPANGTTATAPATFTLAATASDSDGFVTQVDFYSGNTAIGSANSAPFEMTWSGVPAGTYTLTATATDDRGASTTSAPVNVTVAAAPMPPSVPTGLTATGGNATVSLSWNAVSGATSYTVKRATVSGGPYAVITSGITGTTYTDPVVQNGTSYFYVVSASNAVGESGNSNQATATPAAPPTAPAAPGNLAATAPSKSQVNLTWSDNSNNETGFYIERSTDGVKFSQIASVGANIRSYANTGVGPNKNYYYRVRAFNSAGTSPYSNVANVTTPRK
ncbi:Ig-like domain-containing protein [Verrucomicrobiota bacterium sgz303538]